MIKDLFMFDLRENKMLIIIFTLILMMYGTISVSMYNPQSIQGFEAIINMLPEQMIKMFGFDLIAGDITKYLGGYLYGFIMVIFPMIFIIMVGTRLVSRHVDKGSMIYLITMPYTRKRIITTQAVFYVLSLLFVLGFNVGLIILIAHIRFPGLLDIGSFLMLNLVTFAVHLALTGVAFLFSVLFGDSSKSLGVTGVLLISFFVLNMLSSISDKTDFLKYFSPYALINPDYILSGGGNGWLSAVILLVFSGAVFVGSIELFNRKSLII